MLHLYPTYRYFQLFEEHEKKRGTTVCKDDPRTRSILISPNGFSNRVIIAYAGENRFATARRKSDQQSSHQALPSESGGVRTRSRNHSDSEWTGTRLFAAEFHTK